jgi:hypothetical protein
MHIPLKKLGWDGKPDFHKPKYFDRLIPPS